MLLNDVLVEIEEEEVDVSMEDVKIGTTGSDGKDGKDGATFYPSVSEYGILSWTNDQGLDNPNPVNIKGKDGVSPDTDLFSNALNGSKKGNAIAINDISPIEHNFNVNVSLKIDPTSFSVPDEVFQLFQDATDGESSNISVYSGIAEGTPLKLVVTNPGASYFLYVEGASEVQSIVFDGDTYKFTAPNGYFAIAYDTWTIEEVSSEHVLYLDFSEVKVIKAGLNLFKPYIAEKTVNGVTARLTADGFVETSGTFSGSSTIIELTPPSGYVKDVLPAGTYKSIKEYNDLVANTSFDVWYQSRYAEDDSFAANIDASGQTVNAPVVLRSVNVQIKTSAGANIRFPAMMYSGSATNVEFEEYKAFEKYDVKEDGTVDGFTPYKPSTTLMTNIDGATIECKYNRDINKAFAELQNAIISMGGIL